MKFLTFTTMGDNGTAAVEHVAVLTRDVAGISSHSDGGAMVYLDRCNELKEAFRSNEPFDVILKRLEHILAEDN